MSEPEDVWSQAWAAETEGRHDEAVEIMTRAAEQGSSDARAPLATG